MSDKKPFAEVVELHPGSVEPDAVCVGDLVLSYHGCPTIAQRHADALNSAVAARERKAAAKALREAAKAIDGMDSCAFDDFIHGPALWLRCRADDIERGEA